MRVIIAGGGTGGHLYPGIAIAEEVTSRPGGEVLFVGTARGLEAKLVPSAGYALELLQVSGLKRTGVSGLVRGLLRLPRAFFGSLAILRRFRPDVVIGVGGYASGPVVVAARMRGIPTAICEQNSIPGLTNKLLGRFVRRVFLSFDESRRFFKAKKIEMTGNPVRRELVQRLLAASTTHTDAVHVLVCGGSQGAVAVNELASHALIELAKQTKLAIVHQTGEKDLAPTQARYDAAGIAAECRAFIKDMASAYLAADLIIGRAGATTVAELAIAGKPAVLIPYPFAADNHQELNAREMADKGAALMFRQADLTADKLAGALRPLVADAARRAEMGAAMRSLARPGAAGAIVDWATST
jgi:UDP-N-acetylglucosamine--N-acetylmuramyl-(pentapeptide) pyrophosphoryl-undecaprenol N-acetylglucosamine transferase